MLYGEVVITAENGTVSPSTVFLQTGSDTKTVTVTSTSDEDIKVTAAPGSDERSILLRLFPSVVP